MPTDRPAPAAQPPVTLHLVRHGRTVYNTQGRLQGWCDSPLTPEGLLGVRATADHLRGLSFAAAYASPSGRTVTTAQEILVHHPGTPLTTDPGLREFSFGDYEAGPEEALFSQFSGYSMFRSVLEGTFEGLPGGEPGPEYLPRVRRIFSAIERAHQPGENVLVVSHGMTLMAYLAMIGGVRPDRLTPLANASVTTVEVAGDGTTTVTAIGYDPSGAAAPERSEPLDDEASAARYLATEGEVAR
ncbi:MAG TPA: histidine phosphatase family protein [Actinotalea sp.]